MLLKNLCKSWLLGALAMSCVCMQGAAAADANMDKAMSAAFGTKEVKKLKIKGHEFNIKPIKTTSVDGLVTVKGQISHHRTLQDDDQVYYSFTLKADGSVERFEVNVERSLMNQALSFVGDLLKEAVRDELKRGDEPAASSTSQRRSMSQELAALELAIKLSEEKIGTGGWEKSAATIVANVLVRSGTSNKGRVYDRVAYLRDAVKSGSTLTTGGGNRPGIQGTSGANQPQIRDHRAPTINQPKVRDQRKQSTSQPTVSDHRLR